MNSHRWFQQLRSELKKQGVSRRYSDRLLSELYSHYMEMKEHRTMNSNANNEHATEPSCEQLCDQLGHPETLALHAAGIVRGTWAGRHPIAAFIVGGPAITLLLLVASVLISALLLESLSDGQTLQSAPWMGPVMAVLGPLQIVVPATIACWMLCRSVRRSYRTSNWAVAGCFMVAILVATTSVHWTPALTEPGTNQVSIGFSFPFVTTWYQALIPLLFAGLYGLRHRNHDQMPPMESHSIPLNSAA